MFKTCLSPTSGVHREEGCGSGSLLSLGGMDLASLDSDASRKLYLVTPNEDLSKIIPSSLDHMSVDQPVLSYKWVWAP